MNCLSVNHQVMGDCSCCHNSPVDDFFSVETLEEELDSVAKLASGGNEVFQKFKTQIALQPEQVQLSSPASSCALFRVVFHGYNL